MPWQSRKLAVTLICITAGVALAACGLLDAVAAGFLTAMAGGYNVANVFNKRTTE